MDKNEDILKTLIQNTKLEKPSGNFTSGVMDEIKKEPGYFRKTANRFALGIPYLVLIGLALVIAVVVLFFVDFSFLGNLFHQIELSKIPAFFSGMFVGIKEILNSIQLSTISIVVIVGVLGLILLDRLIRKPYHVNPLILL